MDHPLGFAPEAALEGLGFPLWGPGVEVVQLLGLQGFWQHQVPGELAAREAGNIVLQKGKATSIGQYAPVFLPGEPSSLTEKPGRPQPTKSRTLPKWPARLDSRLFCLWELCPSETWVWRWHSCLACGDPGSAKRAGTGLPLPQELWPYQSLFPEPLVVGDQKASLASLSL